MVNQGWGHKYIKGRPTKPFTKSEWKHSTIKRTIGGSFDEYKKDFKKIKYKPRKKRRTSPTGYFLPF